MALPRADIRKARRAKRKENRRLRRNGPTKQWYGGSEDEFKRLSSTAEARVDLANKHYNSAADRLKKTESRVNDEEKRAGAEYTRDSSDEYTSRADLKTGIQNMRADTEGVLTQNSAATDAAIAQNNALAQQRLAQAAQAQSRQSQALAAGMGEGGALAMQQAVAGNSQAFGDLAAQNQVQQNQLAADMRYANAQAAMDARLGTNQQQLAAMQALREQDQQAQLVSSQRQMGLLAQSSNNSQAGAALALDARGQQLQNQQFILGTQMGADARDAQAKYAAAQNTGFVGFFNRLKAGGDALKGAANAADMGPTDALLGTGKG